MSCPSVEVVVHTQALIGESPVWDTTAGVLRWVDVLRGEIHATDPANGSDEVVRIGTAVGAVALRRRSGLVVAAADGFCLVDGDERGGAGSAKPRERPSDARSWRVGDGSCAAGVRWLWRLSRSGMTGPEVTGVEMVGAPDPTVDPMRSVSCDGETASAADHGPSGFPLRMNDAKCDPAGRLWGGNMTVERRPGACALYRLDPDGTVTTALGGVTLSNGLGWSPDGRTMYYIDTPLRTVDAFDFDLDTAALTRRRVLVQFEEGVGNPDGMTVDAEGCLWVAMAHGSAVRRYTPSGQLDTVVPLPITKVTSCTFGGSAMDQLFVTTACVGLSEQDLVAQHLAGAVLCCEVGATGLPADRFAG